MLTDVERNFDYILRQPSKEASFHNGVRDLGRAFGQFCLETAADEHHKAQMRDRPSNFFLDPECEVYQLVQTHALDGSVAVSRGPAILSCCSALHFKQS